MQRAREVLDEYLLYQDVRATTQTFYRRVVAVFLAWCSEKGVVEFTPRTASEFLRDKQTEGCSPYYIRSLRSGLRALLNFSGQTERLRSVRLPPLRNETWRMEDVARLVRAVRGAVLPGDNSQTARARRRFWRTIIPAAWYTGLGLSDLQRLDRSHVDDAGCVRIHRSRTGKLSVRVIPRSLARLIRRSASPPWKPHTSAEYFRREFAAIVAAAGLEGTFKKLRKSAGTDAERLHPGRGHEMLANSRRVFEWHYLDGSRIESHPIEPTPLRI